MSAGQAQRGVPAAGLSHVQPGGNLLRHCLAIHFERDHRARLGQAEQFGL